MALPSGRLNTVSLNTNFGGLRSGNAMFQNSRALQIAIERLATGTRINRAADDAPGVSLRDRYQAQMNGLEEGIRNIQTAQTLVQVAESALDRMTEALQQMRALAVRASDDNLNDADRQNIQNQIRLLLGELQDRASTTSFNGRKLLDGSISDPQPHRLARVLTQTNTFLAQGTSLVAATVVNPGSDMALGGAPGAVSQGTYQVKLVYNTTVPDQVDAVVYFSDGSGNVDAVPVSTLPNVSTAARSYNAGGISFTINQSSTLDVGLTSFVKAYTYAENYTNNQSLVFQSGPDEGQNVRVGVADMRLDRLFRVNSDNGGTYDIADVSVDTQIEAQDLIGQLDDALQYVSEQNLKLGATHNSLSRQLTLSRVQLTHNAGQFSLINDADMAQEAMKQSRSSILVQSGTAMVAQANSSAQFVLQLLR
ncbi:MAG: hypothetical protein FJX76_07395 [Armatimonadetes bacterium]|nr:hypothetical protein [Armatimonadota bacterium]